MAETNASLDFSSDLTPHSVVRVLVAMLGPYFGRIYTFAKEDAIGDGTTETVNSVFLSALPLLAPLPVFRQAFKLIARPMDYHFIAAAEKESSERASVRDHFPRRLMSGRVRVISGELN